MTSKVVSPAKIAGSPQRGSRRGSRLRSLALWLCCFCLAAVACTRQPDSWFVQLRLSSAPAERGASPLPRAVLDHVVVATPTASHRHTLVKSMRAWRRGVRTLVLTNATGEALAREAAEGATHNERWVHVPDLEPFAVTNKAGDFRAALGPLLAAQYFGPNFKWLVAADDDTAFFWPGLLRMLGGLDAADPYFISDAYWSRWSRGGADRARARGTAFAGLRNSTPPKADQPRCVPCTLNTTGLDLRGSTALKTCSCTVADLAREFGPVLAGWKGFPAAPPITAVDGGGGAVLSAGLLRRLDARRFRSCVAGLEGARGGPTTCGGSDCLLTACLWQQGYAYTDPGFEVRHRRTRHGMFLFNAANSSWRQLHRWAADALVGACEAAPAEGCSRLWMDHAVSVHTDGARMADVAAEGRQVQRFLQLMALYASALGLPLDQLAARL